jgi:hypothetical protein
MFLGTLETKQNYIYDEIKYSFKLGKCMIHFCSEFFTLETLYLSLSCSVCLQFLESVKHINSNTLPQETTWEW